MRTTTAWSRVSSVTSWQPCCLIHAMLSDTTLPLIYYTLSFETSIITINTWAECGDECSHYARYELNAYIHGMFCTSMTTAVWTSTCRRRCGDVERYGRPVEENQQRTMSSKTSVIRWQHQLPLLWKGQRAQKLLSLGGNINYHYYGFVKLTSS